MRDIETVRTMLPRLLDRLTGEHSLGNGSVTMGQLL